MKFKSRQKTSNGKSLFELKPSFSCLFLFLFLISIFLLCFVFCFSLYLFVPSFLISFLCHSISFALYQLVPSQNDFIDVIHESMVFTFSVSHSLVFSLFFSLFLFNISICFSSKHPI